MKPAVIHKHGGKQIRAVSGEVGVVNAIRVDSPALMAEPT